MVGGEWRMELEVRGERAVTLDTAHACQVRSDVGLCASSKDWTVAVRGCAAGARSCG